MGIPAILNIVSRQVRKQREQFSQIMSVGGGSPVSITNRHFKYSSAANADSTILRGRSSSCFHRCARRAPLSSQSRPARWLRAAPSSQRVPRRLFVASYKDVAGQKITTLARGDNVLRALAILSSRLGRCPRGNSLSFHRESATIPNFRRNAAARPNLKAPSNRNRKAIARGAAET